MPPLDEVDEAVRQRIVDAVEELEQVMRWLSRKETSPSAVRLSVGRALHGLRNALTVLVLKSPPS